MSNPLRIFRRYQKQLIVFFGVLLMVSFLITGSILNMVGKSPSQGQEWQDTAVKWTYGEISNSQLDRFRLAHFWTTSFLQELAVFATSKGGQPKDALLVSINHRAMNERATNENVSTEKALVRTMMLAKRADELGIVIDDRAVEEYLGRICDQVIKNRIRYEQMIADVSGGRMSYPQLREHLRTELKAEQMRTIGHSGFSVPAPDLVQYTSYLASPQFSMFSGHLVNQLHEPIVSPGTAYDYDKRVNRKIKAELLPMKVADYTSEVKQQPTDSALKEFYERGKDHFPDANRVEPGFKQRQQIAFEYLKADLDTFVEREAASITDEQVRKFYKEHPELFEKIELPDKSDESAAEGTSNNETEDTKAAGQSDTNDDTDNDESKQKESNTGSSDDPASEAKSSSDSDIPKAADSKNDEEEGFDEDDKDSDTNKTDASDTQTSETAQTTETTAKASGDAPSKPAEKKPKLKPLEDVKDEIRKKYLAEPVAREKMKNSLKSAKAEVGKHYRKYIKWEQDQHQDPTLREPARLDVKSIAQKYDLTEGRTPLRDVTEMRSADLGQFLPQEYGQQRRPYSATLVGQDDLNGYVYWRVDEKEEKVPEFDEIRDEVRKAWRLREAESIVKEVAEEKAAQARKEEKPLKDLFGDKVIESGEFSWLSYGNLSFRGGPLSESEIEGVEKPGREFIEAVFALRKGEITVASNLPHSIYYVIRVTSDEIERDFLSENQPSGEVDAIARTEHQLFYLDWLEELEKEMRIQWQRDPQ